MAFPSQTYSSIADLINYINTEIVPNGQQEIDGQALNNALNAVCTFIVEYAVNGNLADINSDSGIVVEATKAVTVFTGAPTSVQWVDNVQNEYYLVNSTGYDIQLSSGYSYTDVYENEQTIIPARQVVHIAKAENGGWVQVDNIGGGGSGSDLPPQVGNSGKFLTTNGSTPSWMSPHRSITSSDFTNATQCPLPDLAPFSLSIFWSDLPNFIYSDAGQWTPLPGGGFEVTIPGFDATNSNYHFELFLKPL